MVISRIEYVRTIGFSGETLKDLGLEEDTKILENNKALSRFTSLDPASYRTSNLESVVIATGTRADRKAISSSRLVRCLSCQ